MRRTYNCEIREEPFEPQVNYLLKIDNQLEDVSTFRRSIQNSGCTITSGYMEVTTTKKFSVPYDNDLCRWNNEGYTIEMDVMQINSQTVNNNHGSYVCQGNNPMGIDYWSFGITKQKLTFYYYNGSQKITTGTTTIPIGEWHNIKMVYLNGEINLYIDGVFEKSSVVAGSPQFSSSYQLVFLGYGANSPGARLKNIKVYKQN